MKKSKIIPVLLFLAFINLIASSPKSNLEIIYNLVEKNVDQLLHKLPHETEPFKFDYNSPQEYSSLQTRYMHKLNRTGFLTSDTSANFSVSFSLDNIEINYSEPFRESLLGNYKVERKVKLNGSFIFKTNEIVRSSDLIESAYSDTLYYSELKNIENPQLLLTQGTKPTEPVFESLLEPIIAVGAVIVTILLLFTVRSK